jgi:hypothetical protein
MLRQLSAFCLGIVSLALLARANALPAQEVSSAPRLSFTKTLKGSSPEFMALTIDANGKGTYESHKLDERTDPRPMQISAGTTAQIFSLVRSLDSFRSLNLETHHKVANMGLKTLSYEAGQENNKVQYNYTENRTAQQLTELLEKIAGVEEGISQLEYEMKYDHLNLPQTLAEIQGEMADHDLVEAALMVPTLEEISSNPRFLHLARDRAQYIMRHIQNNK